MLDNVKNRDMLEASFVFSLWKDPKQYRKYNNTLKVDQFFTSSPAQTYYNIGLEMFKNGYNTLDKVSVSSFLKTMPPVEKEYERNGGYSTFEDIKKGISTENVEGYFNDITKLNCLSLLKDRGFSIETDWHKLSKMSLGQVKNYYSYMLNETFLTHGDSCGKIEDFTITDEDTKFFKEGQAMGFSIASIAPLLNFEMLGVNKGLLFLGAGGNVGKTAFMMGVIAWAWLQGGYKVALASNEQGLIEFKQILISMVSHKLNNEEFLTRRRIKMGAYSRREDILFDAAKEYINENIAKNIMFLKIFDYSMDTVEQFFDIAAARGYKAGIYDVFKAEDAESATARGQMMESSKRLFKCATNNDMTILATVQLALYLENTRYLRLSNIGQSKQLSDPATEILLIRELWDDEVSGGKFDIKCYNFEYNKKTGEKVKGIDGKPIRKYINIPEGEENDYRLVFLAKTRNTRKGIVLVFKYDGDCNMWTELGYAQKVHTKNRGHEGNK